MPKSRFNAVREKARASRHNPIHRNENKNEKDGKSNILDTPLTLQPIEGEKASTDVVPLLKSLPLPNSPSTSSYEDALWALTSLNGFWSTKSLRTELLSPKYDIIGRILVQLQRGEDRPIEVRDAASGCLRNLCIEAGGKVRKALESKGSVSVCIEEMNTVAIELGLKEGDSNSHKPEKRLESNGFSHENGKQKMEMNRKERRHAAKAEAALSKLQSKGQEKEKSSNKDEMDQDKVIVNGSEDDRVALKCSHLNNLSAVIWCLAEMSPQAADECDRAAPLLGRIISQTAQRGTKALQEQRSDAKQSFDSKTNTKIDVGKKEVKLINDAWAETSATCLNALVTLTDSNANFCAALVGIDRAELMTALKKKSKAGIVLDDVLQEEATRMEGRENVQFLCSAVDLLHQSQLEDASDDRRISSNGLLALAVLRNVQSSLPLSLTGSVKTGNVVLSDYESSTGLQVLQNILNKHVSNDVNQEDVNNLNMALEVLAELVGDRESWNFTSSSNAIINQEQIIGEEDEADEEMDMEDLGSDESEQEDLTLGEDDDAMLFEDEGDAHSSSNGTMDFQQTRIANTFSESLMRPLCKLAFDLDPASPALTVSSANKIASTQRGIAIRALSVLNNDLLVLASFAQPPPSQPVQDDSHKQRIASFHAWLSQQHQQIGQIWKYAFEMASRTAASPIMSIDEGSQRSDEDARTANVEVKRILESSLGIMWSLARCYEGVDDSNRVLLTEAEQFAQDPQCVLAGQGGNLIESILAAYRGSSQDSKTSSSQDQDTKLTITADPTTWASADGIRVNCLGLLSALCRQGFVWSKYLKTVVEFLVQTLDALPSQKGQPPKQSTILTSLELSDWTSCDGMVVAINGLIDTFADENSVWDQVYHASNVHKKLKRTSTDIRSAVRSIDKRTQSSLRIAADEALQNLMGFISYRESIKKI